MSGHRSRVQWSGTFSWWLAAFSIAGIATLAWFGYRATAQWQQSSALLVERRAEELAGTLVTALTRVRRATPTFTLQEIINAAQVEIGKIAVAQKTGEPIEEYVTPEFIGRLQFLMTFEKLTLVESDGPLWYRGLATMAEDQQPAVDALLRRYGARRIVLGHTPQLPAGRIRTRFGGLVALIDTGMLNTYFKGGQPSALEIQDGKLTAIYLSGREPLSGTAAVVSLAWAAANAH